MPSKPKKEYKFHCKRKGCPLEVTYYYEPDTVIYGLKGGPKRETKRVYLECANHHPHVYDIPI